MTGEHKTAAPAPAHDPYTTEAQTGFPADRDDPRDVVKCELFIADPAQTFVCMLPWTDDEVRRFFKP